MKFRHAPPPDTRSSLLNSLQDTSNNSAWCCFVDIYAGYIFSLARRSGLQHVDAAEVTQAVLSDFARSAQSFRYDRTKGRFRSWLTTCSRRRIYDHFRKMRRLQKLEAPVQADDENPFRQTSQAAAPEPDAFEALAESEWRDLVKSRALQSLRSTVSASHFAIFHAYVIEGWTVPKVMQTYGASRAQVYQVKHRIFKAFQKALASAEKELESPKPDSAL